MRALNCSKLKHGTIDFGEKPVERLPSQSVVRTSAHRAYTRCIHIGDEMTPNLGIVPIARVLKHRIIQLKCKSVIYIVGGHHGTDINAVMLVNFGTG